MALRAGAVGAEVDAMVRQADLVHARQPTVRLNNLTVTARAIAEVADVLGIVCALQTSKG